MLPAFISTIQVRRHHASYLKLGQAGRHTASPKMLMPYLYPPRTARTSIDPPCAAGIWAATFIDPERFRGTCYRAANWKVLGRTTRRGKDDQTHRPNRSLKEGLG